MRPMSWAVACALVSAGAVAACGIYPDTPVKKVTREQVKEMMTQVHKGEKSPLARTRAEVQKEAPDWEALAKDARSFTSMGELLKIGASPYTSPKIYIDGAAALTKAVKDKDQKAASTAFTKLSLSCVACHGYRDPAK
jgi:hypothetical protein